jgi:hypothetical protein
MWVAFRSRLAIEDWDQFARLKLNRSWPEWGLQFGFNEGDPYPDLLIAALRARASRTLWRIPKGSGMCGWKIRAKARQIIRQTAVDPHELADELEADKASALDMSDQIDEAKRAINAAVRDEILVAFGKSASGLRKPSPSAVHAPLDPLLLLGPRIIELDGWLTEDDERPFSEIKGYAGPYFDEIFFRSSDLLKLWPPLRSDDADGGLLTSLTPVQLSANDKAKIVKKGKPVSSPQLTAWMEERLQSWPPSEKRPTEEEDWAAAKAHFEKVGITVTRDALRQIREDVTPPEWRRQGRRKALDQRNKSAKVIR